MEEGRSGRCCSAASVASEVEHAKERCRRVIHKVNGLPLSRITQSCKATLLKSANSELKFLSRLSPCSTRICSNIGYLESVVHILQQPCIAGVSRVCKPIPLSLCGKKCQPGSAKVKSECENPIIEELRALVCDKRPIICKTVCSEFKELVSLCGGPNEKLRADCLLKYLLVVPDNPSTRIIGLPTTRKLCLKNKVIFGTGDYWHAPTLANMAFVRAISQTGMSLLTFEQRPRALVGD